MYMGARTCARGCGAGMRRTEYIVLGVLLLLGLFAFPAFRDVALVERFALSICAAVGIN